MFFDTDCGGVVSNIAYLRFIEIARTHLAEELGLAVVEMAEMERYAVVVGTVIDYRRARFWCAFRITRSQDNTLIAECRQMLALIEMPTGKLLRLPEHWKTYDKAESGEHSERESQAGTVSDGEHGQ